MKKLLFITIVACGMYAADAQIVTRPATGSVPSGKIPAKIPAGTVLTKHTSSSAFSTGVIDIPKEFKDKYSFDAWISEDLVLHFETSAKISEAKLQVFTPEQLAVRKGVMHSYPFSTPVSSYQFKLTAPAYAGNLGYWLYITTTDGLKAEAYFQKR